MTSSIIMAKIIQIAFDNINRALGEQRPIITPVNLFMHTKINTDGRISVEKPISKAGDKIILKALMDITLGVAACSVSETNAIAGKCSPLKLLLTKIIPVNLIGESCYESNKDTSSPYYLMSCILYTIFAF